VKERSVIFSAEDVRATLAGRKTQFRRALKQQPAEHHWSALPGYRHDVAFHAVDGGGAARSIHSHQIPGRERAFDLGEWIRCPYGAPGDRLWVREKWSTEELSCEDEDEVAAGTDGVRFADGAFRAIENTLWASSVWLVQHRAFAARGGRWRSPVHMPRWASRLTLEVTAVRVERLQDISDADAKAEGARHFQVLPGCDPYGSAPRWSCEEPTNTDECLGSARMAFANLWNKLGGDWDANPWTWVVSFRVVTP